MCSQAPAGFSTRGEFLLAYEYYDILGVPRDATEAQIKKAFRHKARELHPDVNKAPDAEDQFKQLNEAYDCLSDPNKKRMYDQYGTADAAQGFGGYQSMNMDDIFSMFGDIFGGHGGGGFGFGGSAQPQMHQGSDLRIKVKLNLKEVASGVTKKFKVHKDLKCPDCQGTGSEGGAKPETCNTCHGTGYTIKSVRSIFGMMQTQAACPTCHGEGTVIKNKCKTCGGDGVVKGDEVVEINIPAGVQDGMVLTVAGKGNAGKRNGYPGDIQVLISEENNDTFERDGQNLYYNLVLDFATATLGGEVDVPTIEGKTTVKIEPGTQPGKQIRLRGKGLPAVKGYGYGKGDIICNVTVYVPKTLTKEEKELIKKLKDSENIKADNATKKTLFDSLKNLFK